MSRTILLIGAFDVKGEEYTFVKKLIEIQDCKVLTMNIGVLGKTDLFLIDIDNAEVAKAGGSDINQLQKDKDRGVAMKVMSRGVTVLCEKLYKEGRFDGVFGMGGSGGTSVITSGMRTLPIGVPKVIVSTVASGNTSVYVDVKDVVMVPSIVDVAGVNQISEKIFKEAAGAICGMVKMDYTSSRDQKPIIAATMFGNTTPCVDHCRDSLIGKGYEVLVFHCTGTGGRTMEGLVDEGFVYAVLDITTTEWADELCGGVYSAGDTRLDAPGKAGIPHLIVPGCVDMVNFGPKNTVPEKYKDRLCYEWNPSVTLMRTNIEENSKMGEIFAQKANASKGRVAFLLPLKGVSMLDNEGGIFWWPEADRAMFNAIKKNVKPGIQVVEMNCNINEEAFSQKAVEMLMELMTQK
ncbi:MAG: Tm-1-like ATP-binding domain-containing protein [Thermodesulfobacteriota bacterium]|jgi:uncharacterized protein (UPF0261 family)